MYAELGCYEKVVRSLIESWVFYFDCPLPSADMVPSPSSLQPWVLEVGQAFKDSEDAKMVAAAMRCN